MTTPDAQAGISILIVEADPTSSQELRSLLSNHGELHIVGQASTPAQVLALCHRHRLDVVLVGLSHGTGPAFDLLDAVLEADPQAQVLVVSSVDDDESALRCVRAGALGYVLRVDAPACLVTAIGAVATGRRTVSPHVSAQLVEQLMREGDGDEPALDSLELRMLSLISRGLSNPQIADELSTSDTTVKRRLRVIFGKLGVSRRAEAVSAAARRGLLPS